MNPRFAGHFVVHGAANNHHNGRIMASRIFALLIWAAVAASLAYWGLRWLARPTGVPPNATPVSLDSGARGDLHRLLAGPAKAASGPAQDPTESSALAARLKLLGVVAPREGGHEGVALLSVDGKPPRAVRIGGVVDGQMLLQALTQRSASIGPADGPAVVTLDLPLLPAAATGSLPPISGVSTDAFNGQPPPAAGFPAQAMARPRMPPEPAATGPLSSPESEAQGQGQGNPGMSPSPQGMPPAGMPPQRLRGVGASI
jgi:general secretion pathway protein C